MKTKTIKAKLPKSVKRIVILRAAAGAGVSAAAERIVISEKRKRKKQTKGIVRIIERLARRTARANAKTADEYLDRHERSNRKHRDGWLRDLGYNVMRAQRDGNKRLKLTKVFR
jgi:hypothetical protein